MKLALLTALMAAALGGEALSAFRSREPRLILFDPAPRDPAHIQVGTPGVTRSRLVTIDFAALQASLPTEANGHTRPALLINMFDDLAYNAEVDRVDLFENGFAWVGHVPGYDLSTVTLASVDGVVAGSIVMPDAVFVVRYLGNGAHEIAQIDQAWVTTELAPAALEPEVGVAAGGHDSATSVAGTRMPGGAAGAGAIAYPAPVVNIRGGENGPAAASVEDTGAAPASVGIGATRIKTDSGSAGPEAERTAAVDAGKAASRGWPAWPFGSWPDNDSGRLAGQPSPDVPRGSTLDAGPGDPAAPHPSEVAGEPIRTVVTTPENGAEVSSPFALSGWIADPAGTLSTGVESVQVWAFPAGKDAPGIGQARGCSDPGAAAIWLGTATPVPPGPDGDRHNGPPFPDASYRLDINTLAPGLYDVLVCPQHASTGQFEGARAVRVTVR